VRPYHAAVFLPLGTDRPRRRPTLVTHALIAANALVFIGMLLLAAGSPALHERAMATLHLSRGSGAWSWVTYAFLHAGPVHLLGNLLFLWVFGPNVEDRIGRIGFTAFYLTAAAAAGLGHVASSPAPVVGASGAISAVTGAYLVLFPRTHVRTLIIFLFIGVFMIPAWWFIAFAIFWDFVPMLRSGGASRVAYEAHLAGYGFGILVSVALLWTRAIRREPYDLFTIGRQAARRRQFREVEHATRRERERAERRAVAAAHAPPDLAAEARARVSTAAASGDMAGAASAYRDLLREFGDKPGAVTLTRRAQYDVANHLFASGDQTTAAIAYERFLAGYPNDAEAPTVRLMLALINTRYLNDPVTAKGLLDGLDGALTREEERALARELMDELG